MTKIRIVLTNDEYNLLNRISRKTKADCWFSLAMDKDGSDCVYDTVNRRKLTLRFAVNVLCDAIVPNTMGFTENEKRTLCELLNKLHIKRSVEF